MRTVMFLASALMAAVAVSGAKSDVVTLAGKGDAEALLKAVSQGDPATEPNAKGQLPLVAAGAHKSKLTSSPARKLSAEL